MKVCPVCQREFAPGTTNCIDDGVGLVDLATGSTMRPEELVGTIVEGRYKIERIIGKGGMGTVYACRHVVVGKVAAIKVLRVGGDTRSDGVLQRFIREAQTANSIKSRHIAEVTDFGQLAGGPFFVVMELLEGHDLAHAMRHNSLTRAQMIHVFVQTSETLALAHDLGIVHRDLKPDNVFLVNETGDPAFVKLLDFGIAKVLHGDNSGLTETGVILGTPYYMSPEQARADSIDHRSDIYSLGVMMYRAFTGRLPFMADSTMGVLTRHLTEAPEPPSRINNVDPMTERMILTCMEKRRENRFQSMRDVAAALKALPGTPGVRAPEAPTVQERAGIPAAPPSGAYGAYPSGAHAAYAQPSAAHPAHPAQPQAYAQPGYPSGAHQAYPSGAHAAYAQPSGAHPAASGQYGAAAMGTPVSMSGAYAAHPGHAPAPPPSGSHPAYAATAQQVQQGFDPRVSGGGVATPYPGVQQGSGAFPAAQQGSGAFPAAQQGSGAFAPVQQGPIGGEIGTTRGLAAAAEPVPKKGGLGMAILGGVVALALCAGGAALYFRGAKDGAAAVGTGSSASAAVTATAAPPTATASASAAPAESASAAPSATAAKPRGPVGPKPAATPAATSTAPPPKRPGVEIRSPFE